MKNLTGKKFGKLTVLKRTGTDKRGQAIWLCKCECGNTIETITNRLNMGKTKSCGCLALENKRKMHITHGKAHTKTTFLMKVMMLLVCGFMAVTMKPLELLQQFK